MCINWLTRMVISKLPPAQEMMLFAILVVLPVAILQLGAAQQCSCTTGIAVVTQDDLKKEIRTEVAAALVENGVANITNTIQQAVNATIERAMEDISTEIGQLVAPLLAQFKHLQLPGKTPSHPATSCKEIQKLKPSSPSGYYWITASDESAVHMYCDINRTCGSITGGWMRVASIDMTNSSQQCPNGLKAITKSSKRLCGRKLYGPGCSSTVFQVHGIKYTHMCGKVIGYQDKFTDAFQQTEHRTSTIDGNYVDGVSITHGYHPRKHIWTFAAAVSEATTVAALHPTAICSCTNSQISPSFLQPVPSFIGNDYFCDTGNDLGNPYYQTFYPSNPLWNGQGCGSNSTCCSFNTPPWFFKTLSSSVGDNLELRICSDENSEDTPLEKIELYVQ